MALRSRDIVAAQATVWQGSDCVLMGRFLTVAAAYITQAGLSEILCSIFNMTDAPTVAAATPTVTIATAVFDTLQTDDRWTLDDIGYNFRFTATAAQLALGGKLYRYEFKFTEAAAAGIWKEVFDIDTAKTYGA